MKRTTVPTALLAVALAIVAAACGGSGSTDAVAAPTTAAVTTTTAPSTSTTVPERPTGTRDGLVAIDHGRMHLRCVGSGTTTVLLLAGWDGADDGWGAIEPAIGERARVCSYARFGTGASDAPSADQTFETQVADLHALLEAADEPGPYVVLGHSFGGAEAVTFAHTYPDEVTGLLLLDTSPSTWPATLCSVPAWAAACATMHDPSLDAERLDVFPAFAAVDAISSLGDLPMTVVTGPHRVDPTVSAAELAPVDAAWMAGQQRWAGLSSRSSVVVVQDTGHHIEIDQPERVIDEVVELLTAAES